MSKAPSRRDALKTIATASAVALTHPAAILAQPVALAIAGKPVEIIVSSVSPDTLRVSITPLVNGQSQSIPNDGSLVQTSWGKPLARVTTLPREQQVRAGNLVVKFTPDPLTIRIEAKDGRLVQELRPDMQTGTLSFLLDDKPVLGFGEGGPQFDRRGETYTNRNGQGGYRLRTHGGRVPIQ